MFTGLTEHRGKVAEVSPTQAGARLVLDARGWSHAAALGESIAVNGCCLTVAAFDEGLLRFDVIHQTLRTTTLGRLREGDRVNIEHAATPSTLLGGHIVQGHVDGVGVVLTLAGEAGEHRVSIEPPGALMEYLAERGSIALDGVSLTIASVGESWFEVALIPTTLEMTTLGTLRAGDQVNIEADYLAKIVVEWLKRRG